MTSSSEVYIEGTSDDPVVRARAAVRDVHDRLRAGLATAVRGTPQDGGQRGPVEFCTGELRRHLAATEQTLYAAASGAAGTRLLVRALRTTAGALDRRIDGLAGDGDAASVAAGARAVEAILDVHLTTEETVLLPALADLPGADLPGLVADLTTLLEGGRLETPSVVDVREIPHGQRHPRIFARYARLAPGEGFVLVNNHDPKPLRREFEATQPGTHTWDYVESGPDVWRVRIGRAAVEG
ncbi:DUF2249 domain-containing protein [Streptomyces sp. NPDC048110]|uniref:DUF2249 domain-containing protein n=1 Tax=Streptomyces sp. NPDC048110 TaxID=3155483 RepID=UPI003408503E